MFLLESCLVTGGALLGAFMNVASITYLAIRAKVSLVKNLILQMITTDLILLINFIVQNVLDDTKDCCFGNPMFYGMVTTYFREVIDMASTLCALLLSFERYIRICRTSALRPTSILSVDTVKFHQLGVILFPILFCIPLLLLNNQQTILHVDFDQLIQHFTHKNEMKAMNITSTINDTFDTRMSLDLDMLNELDSELDDDWLLRFSFLLLTTVFSGVLPILLIIIFNTKAILQLRENVNQMRALNTEGGLRRHVGGGAQAHYGVEKALNGEKSENGRRKLNARRPELLVTSMLADCLLIIAQVWKFAILANDTLMTWNVPNKCNRPEWVYCIAMASVLTTSFKASLHLLLYVSF